MESYKEWFDLSNFKDGWFIGNFEPSIFKNCFFEVAYHKHSKGPGDPIHVHKIATEANYIIKGKIRLYKQSYSIELQTGQIFVFDPGQPSKIDFLEDTELMVIKWPSVPTDKHLV